MNWGPKKLLDFLIAQHPEIRWPSACIAEKWLKRRGLVKSRRLRRRTPKYSEPFLTCNAPNKVWSADYKGQFKTGDGRWCYPLTITDNMSRYLLMCKGLYSPCHADTQPWFEWAFREFGLPDAIRTDNGTPFASRSVTGLSRLSIWWIKLGIRPERIESGKPQQNGRHERPHEALDRKTPASVYHPSSRRFPEKLRNPEYDHGVKVRTIHHNGEVRFKRNHYYVSELLYGDRVGLVEIADGTYEIRFGFHPIGLLDLRLGKVVPKSIKV